MPQGIHIKCAAESADAIVRYAYQLYNNAVSVEFDVAGATNELVDFGLQLQQFPLVYTAESRDYRAVFQKGKNRQRFHWYFRIEAFVYKTNGAAALQIVYDNNADGEYADRAEFSIRTSAASLIELGDLLAGWNPMEQAEMVWTADE
jgi:hypothetical protein